VVSDGTLTTVRQRCVDAILDALHEWSIPCEVRYGEPPVKIDWDALPTVWVWDDTDTVDEEGTQAAASFDQIEFRAFDLTILVAYDFDDDRSRNDERNVNRRGNALRGALQATVMADPTLNGNAFNLVPVTLDIHRATLEGVAMLMTTWRIQYHDNIRRPWEKDITAAS
jgi:hypothetical protein